MLCKKCNNCGLCEGTKNSFDNKSLVISTKIFSEFKGIKTAQKNDVGIAVDIGTTTIAACAFNLFDGTEIFSSGIPNAQKKFGSDVISRINYAAEQKGFEELSNILLRQLLDLIENVMMNVQSIYLGKRKGTAVLKKIIFEGNTAMESFAAGVSVNGLSVFPFKVENYFGFTKTAGEVFKNLKLNFISENIEVYFVPVLSAFIGGDTVCALLNCLAVNNSYNKKFESFFLADVGTNCEMAFFDCKSNKLVCTSSSAGPAFEGQGIEMGMQSFSGAIADLKYENNEFVPFTIGGAESKGVCGTGILSAINVFLDNKFISREGTILSGNNKIYISDKVYISQNDIRNIQLAKSAVYTGLQFLLENNDSKKVENSALFLAGGFGTKINENHAVNIKMIPSELKNIIHSGNAALSGASLFFDEENIKENLRIIENAKIINLAEEEKFQSRFIDNLNM